MTVTEKVFFDTAPFIYLIENHSDYYAKVEQFFVKAEEDNWELMTSVLSIAEFGVKPEKEGRQDLIIDLDNLLIDFHFQVVNINIDIARQSYQLRAKYNALKAMDSIQLATAIKMGCSYFFTNDKKLKKTEELNVILVEEVK